MVFANVTQQLGFQTVAAPAARLLASAAHHDSLIDDVASNHRRLQALADHFGPTPTAVQKLRRFAATLVIGGLGEAVSRSTSMWAADAVASSIRPVPVAVEPETLPMPRQVSRMAA